MKLKTLMGSGDKILRLTAPFLIVGLTLNILFPSVFRVGGPSILLKALSIIFLIPGVAIWMWSVFLVVTRVPRKQLITSGPYSLVRHPIYTSVGLLVLPWVGFLFNTWLGALVGAVLYAGSRRYALEEEVLLSKSFGAAWEEHRKAVKLPWL